MGEFNFAEELKKMPQTPGVYLMHDAHDDVIYVGKAVNLKRRVSSYFRKSTKRTTKIPFGGLSHIKLSSATSLSNAISILYIPTFWAFSSSSLYI